MKMNYLFYFVYHAIVIGCYLLHNSLAQFFKQYILHIAWPMHALTLLVSTLTNEIKMTIKNW